MKEDIVWGLSGGGHDAALAVIKHNEVIWASHSERYSKIKNDDRIDPGAVAGALKFGKPDTLVWHEKPVLKLTRELWAKQWNDIALNEPRATLANLGLNGIPVHTVSHHHSHAAGGYYTSGFDSAAILVIDAIGEWDTTSVWMGQGSKLTKLNSSRYPNSLGLFYTALTQRCGFKPNEEEYIMMGLSACGYPWKYKHLILDELIEILPHWPFYRCRVNMHRGIRQWQPDITDVENLAAAAQEVFTDIMLAISKWLQTKTDSKNLVVSGGCALNCVTNTAIAKQGIWDKIWIMPNPGDAGNSLGAALAFIKKPVEWAGPYLGDNIEGLYPVSALIHQLHTAGVVGVANGRAEFGPRALGNRSLLADPRLNDIQDRLNNIKKREWFRPFAPVILEEFADQYFETLGQDMSYMQYTVQCKQPEKFPGIVHVDGTSRVQTVNVKQNIGLYQLLKRWYSETGCPMLVNTSLNIKGQPMVNDTADAIAFEAMYGIKVFTRS